MYRPTVQTKSTHHSISVISTSQADISRRRYLEKICCYCELVRACIAVNRASLTFHFSLIVDNHTCVVLKVYKLSMLPSDSLSLSYHHSRHYLKRETTDIIWNGHYQPSLYSLIFHSTGIGNSRNQNLAVP